MWLGSLKEAEGYARAAVRGSLWLHSSHPIRMRSLQVLSSALRLQGEWEKAERMQEKVVRNHERFFGADNSNTLQARGELSELHISQDHWTIAEEILREVYPLAVGILGHNDPDTLQYMVQYGRTLNCLGRYEEAGAILTDASARAEASLGSENYTTTVAKFWLASTHRKQGHLCKAGELLTDVLNIETNRYGEDSEKLHAAKVELALTYLASNSHSKVEEAVELLGDVTETCRSHAGNCIPLQLSYTAQYAAALAKLGEYTEAEELARMVLKKCERQLGSDSPKTVSSLETLADILISQGKLFEAEALEGRALKLRQTVLQKDDSHLFCTMRILASIWCSLGRVEEAKKLQRKAQKRCKRIFGVGHPETLSGARNLVKICITRGDFSEAETVQLRVIREQLRQPDVDSLQMVDDARRLMFIYSQQGRVEDMKAVRSRLLERTENLSGELRSQALEKASTPCNPAVASSGGI
ncbi:TPR-like protein [Lepidopterella palustris CBS 459.81]|uniref:TPR-like protein n=1 Tax=Lepidopterella palustris CBS 459.81 TaxID=1314670 RepID=A0A8E2JD95_9PEZI|nr:TPR-like protein [Lepidopterella palustris CBS 459.81]